MQSPENLCLAWIDEATACSDRDAPSGRAGIFVSYATFLISAASQADKKKGRTLFNVLPFLSQAAPSGTRTLDPLIKSQLLYQLS